MKLLNKSPLLTTDIGVRTNNILSWEPRISRLCQRTYSRLNFLNRIFEFLPKYVLLRIYTNKNSSHYWLLLTCVAWLWFHIHKTRWTNPKSSHEDYFTRRRIRRNKCTHAMKCVAKLRLLSQNSRRRFFRFNIIIFKILYNLGGRQQLLGQVFLHSRNTLRKRELRDKTRLYLPKL